MTADDRLLLMLARGGLTADLEGRVRALAGGITWSGLLDRAAAHGVAPLLAQRLEALGWPATPHPVRAALESARRINAARNLLVARALGRVLDGLARARVPVIPLKGVALAESLYGDAGLRVSSDIDVLVPRACVGRAFAVMRELGYARADHEEPVEDEDLGRLLASNIEYAFASPEPPGCLVELHWDIAWRWPRDALALADLWADARPRPFRGAPAQALGPEWELLYLAVHAARHRWGSLKWLVDVHEVCRRGELDWGRVWNKAARFGLTDTIEITLGACAALLDTPVPSRAGARALPDWLELFPATPAPVDLWQGALYPARLFARPSEKLCYLGRVLLVPTLAERRLIHLPARLGALYYLLRPLRLSARWGRDATVKWLDRLRPSGRSSRLARGVWTKAGEHEKGSAARRPSTAARRAESLYVERAARAPPSSWALLIALGVLRHLEREQEGV